MYRVHTYDQRAHFGYSLWIAGGHSFGADLALRYALRHPHRLVSLVYICQALTIPVLILQGGKDPRPTAACDSLVQALPTAARIVLPEAGHLPWTEEHEQARMILRDFLTYLDHDTPA
jgi:pimeloyl-ACP methyl ester carboxylesterase